MKTRIPFGLAVLALSLLIAPTVATVASVQTWDIFGQVTGPAASGTELSITGPMNQDPTTGPTGLYSGRWLLAGTYRVMPRRTGFSFTPEFRDVTVGPGPGSAMGIDFVSEVVDPGGGGEGGGGGGGGGGGSSEDTLLLHKLKVSPSKGKVKIKATLVPMAGHGVFPEDALAIELDGVSVLAIPADGFVMKGSSGLKWRYGAEGVKVTLKLGAAGQAKLKVKLRDVAAVGLDPEVRVVTGDFDASATPR